MELAREHNCQRMVALGPLLVHDLFETPLPEPVEAVLARDDKLQQQREERLRYLFDPDHPQNFATQRTQAKMLERWRDKAIFWLRWALTPDRPSIERVSLPFPLFLCYPLVRLHRLVSMSIHRSLGRQGHRSPERK